MTSSRSSGSFLGDLSGESREESSSSTFSSPRIATFLFYEFIASPDMVRRFRNDPAMKDEIDKALLWYSNYRTLFESQGKLNLELGILLTERETRTLSWRDWFGDRHVFLKGLRWQKIL